MPGGERPAGAQVHHPFPGLDPPAQLGGVGAARHGQVGPGRPGGVRGAHVRVVRGVGVQPGQQLGHVPVFVQDQRRVGPPFPADGRRGALGLGGRAEAAEPVGGIHVRVFRQLGGQAVRRRELRMRQLVGVAGAEQVRPAGRAVQQRPAGEHRVRAARGLQHVGQVGERVPGGGYDPDPHHRADLDQVPVSGRNPVEGHRIGRVDVVGRPGGARQRQPAGHVVVVQVGLEDMGDPHPPGRGQVQHPVDVPLRVDDHGDLPVVRKVAPVAQRRRVNGHHLDAGSRRHAHRSSLRIDTLVYPWGYLYSSNVRTDGRRRNRPSRAWTSATRRSGWSAWRDTIPHGVYSGI